MGGSFLGVVVGGVGSWRGGCVGNAETNKNRQACRRCPHLQDCDTSGMLPEEKPTSMHSCGGPYGFVDVGDEADVVDYMEAATYASGYWATDDERISPDFYPSNRPEGFGCGNTRRSLWIVVDGAPVNVIREESTRDIPLCGDYPGDA